MTLPATANAPFPLSRTTAKADLPAGVAKAAIGSDSMMEKDVVTLEARKRCKGPDSAGALRAPYAFFRFFAAAGGASGGRLVCTSTMARAVRFCRSRASSHCCGMLAMLLTA